MLTSPAQPTFETLPPEIIQSIASYVPRRTLKALRLTCCAVEAAVRGETLSVLSLNLSTDCESYENTIAQLKALTLKPTPKAPEGYRNLAHVRTLAIAGTWTTFSRRTTLVMKRRWLFWRKTEITSKVAPRLKFEGPWPSVAELNSGQPIRLLEELLRCLDNVRELRLSLSSSNMPISPPAWQVLSAWMHRLSDSLTKIRITSSESLEALDKVPGLVNLASRMNINIEWDHIGTLGPFLGYINSTSPFQPAGPLDISPKCQIPRITHLAVSVGGQFDFNAHHLRYLSHVRVLDITSHRLSKFALELGQGPETTRRRWDEFWVALADNNVRLEEITAPYSPAFKTYVQSYNSTLKTLRLHPLRWSIVLSAFEELYTPGFEYEALANHLSTLEVLDIRSGDVYWELEKPEGQKKSWRYANGSVEPLFNQASSLRRLCVPLLTSCWNAIEHVTLLIQTIAERLPNLEELEVVLFVRTLEGAGGIRRHPQAVGVVKRVLDSSHYNCGDRCCPSRKIVVHEHSSFSDDVSRMHRTKVWERWVDWEGPVYRYR